MNEVYLITNRVNGKRYVGITCRGYINRYKEHIHEALNGSKSILHNAIRKYGPENFDIIVLESNIPDNIISEREQYYIKLYNTFYTSRIGYNMTEGGGGVAGFKHSETSKAKIRDSLKGHVFSESRNRKISARLTGVHKSQSHRKALSNARLGKFTKSDNPFYGKHHSKETIEVLSKKHTKFAVLQFDLDKNFLYKFPNTRFAANWVVENNYSYANPSTCEGRIREVCRLNSDNFDHIGYGFIWKFEEKSID